MHFLPTDLYKNIEKFSTESIDVHIIWVDLNDYMEGFKNTIHSKVKKFTNNYSNHYLYSKNDIANIGLNITSFPKIAIYNQTGSLMFEVPEYSDSVVEDMLKVGMLTSPFIVK